jgi:transposase
MEASLHTLFVGVDIAARSATVAWISPGTPVSQSMSIEQTSEGFTKLQKSLLALGYAPSAVLVVMEATGSYWISLATNLVHAGFGVSVINPHQAHHFAKALLKRSKTDAIDAQTLAQLAALLQPARWSPPPAIYHELQQRLAERDVLINLRQQVRNQRHALIQQPVVIEAVQARMEELIKTFNKQITVIDKELMSAFQYDEAWSLSVVRLLNIPGVGLISAAWMLVATLNFTVCESPEAAASYAGLVPRPHQSGSSVRGRPSIGHTGHGRLRAALYMATLSAAQHNPVIQAFYKRLREAGKAHKVARCAAARKLLHIAWAVVRKERPFHPTHHVASTQNLKVKPGS